MPFIKATKHQQRVRLALIGPSGSGKTYTALAVGRHLGSRVALVDTEHGSASLYADEFPFETLELGTFSPDKYIEAIQEAERAAYDVLIIDSLSHAWAGKGGALEMVDQAAKRSQSGNKFTAWGEVTPKHLALVEAMLGCKMHLIVTMRSKMEYVQETDERGRTRIRKVGMQPIQRDGLEYEFDVVGDVNSDHELVITKTRCKQLTDRIIPKPGEGLAKTLRDWLSGAEPVLAPATVPPQPSANADAAQPAPAARPPAPNPQPNGAAKQPEKPPVYVRLQIDGRDYQVPSEFQALGEPELKVYADWAQNLWGAKTTEALEALARELFGQRTALPECVYAQLVRVGKARREKLTKEARSAHDKRAA